MAALVRKAIRIYQEQGPVNLAKECLKFGRNKVFRQPLRRLCGVLILRAPKAHYLISSSFLQGNHRGPIVNKIYRHIYALERGELNNHEFINAVYSDVVAAHKAGEFDEYFAGQLDERNILARSNTFAPGKDWRLQIFHVPEGEEDLPHHHNNLSSFQHIVSGELELIEYDRVDRVDDSTITIKKETDTTLGPGDYFTTHEDHRNVHWFKAINGPVTSINFNITGYWDDLFDKRTDNTGRHYIVPEDETFKKDLMEAREVTKEEAQEAYGI